MAELEKVIRGLKCVICPNTFCWNCTYFVRNENDPDTGLCDRDAIYKDALELLKAQEPITGETSDGYHTFNELYHHRAVLFSVIVANYPDRAWKSKKHHDGTMYDNMFIVGIDTPDGQATYHYDVDPYWDMFKCRVLDYAPEWDGHTPTQAIERIGKLKAQEPRVMPADEIVLSAEPSGWLCLEMVNGHCGEAYKAGRTISGFINFGHGFDPLFTSLFPEDYGKTWRCWTSRPTDKQRAETPWSEPSKEG